MISVIIATYNRYEMLKEAIESVYQQNYEKIEVIVVDDNSTDDTAKIKTEFPQINYYKNEVNKGAGYSRLLGYEKSKGKYIIFLDDDDYYTDFSFFKKAINLLRENESYVFISANAETEDIETGDILLKKLNVEGEMNSVEYLSGFPFKYNKPLSTFTTVFRNSNLIEAELNKMKMVNDMAIYMRSLRKDKIFFLNDVVGRYRVHTNNISKNISADFLIGNLEEKFEIYTFATEKSLFKNIEEWWIKQIKGSVFYYVYGSRPKFNEYNKVYRWCKDHSNDKKAVKKLFKPYKKYLVDCLICDCKQYVKSLLNL